MAKDKFGCEYVTNYQSGKANENVVYNFTTSVSVLSGWQNITGHKANIEFKFLNFGSQYGKSKTKKNVARISL